MVRETKSQSAETTFDVDVADHEAMAASLASLAEELCRRLRTRGLEGRTIGIKVRLDDWTNVTRSHTVDAPTNDPAVVAAVALELLRAYSPPRPVRLLGVRRGPVPRATPLPRRTRRSLSCSSGSRPSAAGFPSQRWETRQPA